MLGINMRWMIELTMRTAGGSHYEEEEVNKHDTNRIIEIPIRLVRIMMDYSDIDREHDYYYSWYCNDDNSPYIIAIVVLTLILLVVSGLFIWYVIRQRSSEVAEPIIIVPAAQVVAKKKLPNICPWYSIIFKDNHDSTAANNITLKVGKADFVNIREGDVGELTYQGSRYKGFILHNAYMRPNQQRQEQLPMAEAELVLEPTIMPHCTMPSDPSAMPPHLPPAYAPHYETISDQ
jgi:hypothetical protein